MGIVVVLLVSVAGVALGAGSFSDDDGNIHEANIEYIASLGVTRGCNPPANTLYCPDEPVSRGAMAAFLRRALELPFTGVDHFSDDDDSIFENDINAIAEAGITRGCNPPANTLYCPDQPVTRGAMAAFLVRGFGYTAGGGDDLFVDDDNSIFENDIDKLGTAGVTLGCNPPVNDQFCPNQVVVRDTMASFLARAIQKAGGPPPTTTTTSPTTTTTTSATTTSTTTTTTPPPPAGTVEFRVNAGGPPVADSPADWESDDPASAYLAAGGNGTSATTASIDLSHPSVPAGTPEVLFQTERFDRPVVPEMTWAFPVDAGAYRVNLYFAEIFTGITASGQRVFDVSIEGVQVLDDLDIFAQVGLNAGLVTSHDVSVSDGQLNILFTHEVENPAVKAIEIIDLGSQPGTLSAAPGSVHFGEVVTGDTDTASVLLTNLGGAGDPAISVSGATISGTDAGEFSHDLSTPLVLAPGDSQTVTLTHDAGAAGSKAAALSITHNGDNSPLTVNLSATDVDSGAQTPSAYVAVTPSGGLNASTFNNGQIVVQNTSTGGVEIEEVVLNLTGSVVSDAVFDPDDGTPAGDTVGKDFTPNFGAAATGFDSSTLSGDHDDGFDELSVLFTDFEPGEQFTFSIDIDPTSIKGADQPGPSQSGSISGLELSGATVEITFSDGSILAGNLFGSGGLSLGDVDLESGAPDAPSIAFVEGPSPLIVTDQAMTVRISGTSGQKVSLLQGEYGLFLDGAGFDIEPQEVNKAITIKRYSGTIEASGFVDIPVVLENTNPAGGYNLFIATFIEPNGDHTNTSNVLFAELDLSGVLDVSPAALDFGDVESGGSSVLTVTLTNLGSGSDPDIVISAASIGGTDAGEFSHDLTTPHTLGPGESVAVNVTFTAGADGAKSAVLSFTHDGANSPVEVNLSGTATTAP